MNSVLKEGYEDKANCLSLGELNSSQLVPHSKHSQFPLQQNSKPIDNLSCLSHPCLYLPPLSGLEWRWQLTERRQNMVRIDYINFIFLTCIFLSPWYLSFSCKVGKNICLLNSYLLFSRKFNKNIFCFSYKLYHWQLSS